MNKSPARRAIKACLALYHRLVRLAPDGNRTFFDPAAFAWIASFERDWERVREEAESLLSERRNLPSLAQVDPDSADISVEPWRLHVLRIYGRDVAEGCRRCPQTAALVRRVPEITTALFSILEPGHIPHHTGPFAGVLRYHLALMVPSAGRCEIRVGDEHRRWTPGASLVFDDTQDHEVWNESEEIRVVLFVDFIRPLPWPLSVANRALIAIANRTGGIRAIQDNAARSARRLGGA